MRIVNATAPRPPAKPEGLPREKLEAAIRKTPFAGLLDASLSEYGAGKVELTVPVSDKLTQHHGFVHGAVLSFLADSACAWAAASVVGDVVTSEYKMNLLAPAVGTTLIGRGEVITVTGRQVVCRADVFVVTKDGKERMVATALATIARMKPE
jgi:uncharacterized protein (TIGR00369 family)